MHVITDSWKGEAEFPKEALVKAPVVEDLINSLVEKLRIEMQDAVSLDCVFDVQILPEDLIVSTHEHKEGDTVHLMVRWSPSVEKGVHFRGGSRDGECFPIPTVEDGRVPDTIRLTVIRNYVAEASDEPIETETLREEYRVAGIDAETSKWVYDLHSQQVG